VISFGEVISYFGLTKVRLLYFLSLQKDSTSRNNILNKLELKDLTPLRIFHSNARKTRKTHKKTRKTRKTRKNRKL